LPIYLNTPEGLKLESQMAEKWPETMWPISVDFLRSLPPVLLPDCAGLHRLRYPWELLELINRILADRIKDTRIDKNTEIGNYVNIVGPVWIEDGVEIYPFSSLCGPLYIGKNVIVGNNTNLRHVVIGASSVVGFGSEIARTVIGEQCMLHRNYVGDSLLAERVFVGGGTSTSNFRLDGDTVKTWVNGEKYDTDLPKFGIIVGNNTRFGADCKTMPGIKIGSNCIVGPRSTLFHDLPNNMQTKVQQELQIKKRLDL